MKKTKAILGLSAFSLSGCLAIVLAANLPFATSGAKLESPLLEEYDYGDSLSVPSYTFDNGKTVKGIMVYPDGTSTSSSDLTLDQYGYYTITYTALSGNETLYHEEHFMVRKNLFTYNNLSTSSISYEIPEFAKEYTSAKGVYVSLTKGDTLTIEEPIDVSDMRKDQPLVTGFVTPKTQGEYDYSQMTFTFTDVDDPSVYLTFLGNGYADYDAVYPGITYWKAAGNGQTLAGWDTDGHHVTTNFFGTKTTFTFNCKEANDNYNFRWVDPSQYGFRLAVDGKTLETYTCGEKCSDLDDSTYYSKLWSGFPSGRARLSVSCGTYNDTIARFCVTSVLGVDINQKKYDVEPPKVTVDNDYDTLPEGRIGTAYPVPKATAKDGEKNVVPVETRVYYNYNSENPESVEIKDDKFVPTKNGYYAIVYRAIDAYHQEGKEILWVHVGGEISPITALVSTEIQNSYPVGTIIDIPELINLKGGSGKLSVATSLRSEDSEVQIVDNKAQPLKTGHYTLRYSVKDYFGTETIFGKAIEIVDNNHAVLASVENDGATGYISGQSYKTPNVYAYTFQNGKADKSLCDVEISDASGSKIYQAGASFTPSVSNNGDTIKLRFLKGEDCVYEKTEIGIIAYENNRLKSENYFLGSGYTANGSNNGIDFVNNGAESDWKFFSKLISENFSLNVSSLSGVDEFSVTLTDSQNENISFTGTIKITDEETSLILDGGNYVLSGSSLSSFTYSYQDGIVSIAGLSFEVNGNNDGSPFASFPSRFVKLSVSVKGDSDLSYSVRSINSHVFSSSSTDRGEPEYYVDGEYGGAYEKGAVYIARNPLINDVIQPVANLRLSVTDPDGETVCLANGDKLANYEQQNDLQIELTKYGRYTFIYTIDDQSDLNGNRSNQIIFSYNVNCVDSEAPVITFTSGWTKEAKVGDVIVMPNFKVTDNLTSSEDITIVKSVVNPLGNEILLPEGSNSIKTTSSGIYTFKILAIDESGNASYATAKCLVKQGGK